jgi:cation:H+ antiporter
MTAMDIDSVAAALGLVVVGIAALALGASWLVDGASRLALRLGISPMVVGLTVVGFGTSMPEFMVSVLAAGRGSGGLSLGNAVGSNVMNLLLVLGTAAVIMPIVVAGGQKVIRRDLIFGLLPVPVLVGFAWGGHIDRLPAVLLILIFSAFMTTCLLQARAENSPKVVVSGHPLRHLTLTVVGIVVLVVGAEAMVRGAVVLASRFGISEAVIGLTVVALGTSLPELATSVVAALKRESEISVGNVLGSNVFNLGLIIGTAFLIRPGAVPTFVVRQDIPVLLVATIIVGAVILKDGCIKRKEGVIMLAFFAAYELFVILRGGG